MMSIVKKEMISAARFEAVPADTPHQRGIIPFVNKNEIRPIERAIEIERVYVIGFRLQQREPGAKFTHRFAALRGDQVRDAPTVLRLVNIHVVPAFDQFDSDAAQEMSVTMIPIRNQRVIEHYNLHAATSSTSSLAFWDAEENSLLPHAR